ncbi:polysaccharide pyruvyl transferase family protein [Bradyrhizobium sp. G127]|uniref:polysaccharide pyruvyl transferase family protein n=1 Tax=Bradyrhizobium sp. G127 TaxID=2904800 RepID=UPI001F1EFC16|nr:polysaccharide pyruvyl transferase family protein [Bradyrhizobium sp. G127]MCF2524443.1 polysaccharide pyruvyl transferase family protein [Bradyrhizobium sp. G127]
MDKQPADRFFLYGYYGQGNLGDDLLMLSVIMGICEICPGARFTVRNAGPIRRIDQVGAPVKLTNIDSILADQSKGKVRRTLETLLVYRLHFRSCAWFVFGGGTLFHERKSVAPLILLALICLLARLMGLRIAALGVGVAELKSRLGRLALRIIVSTSELFAVRDDLAYAECKKAGCGSKATLTGDLVFGLTPWLRPAIKNRTRQPEPSTRHVGLSINSWLLNETGNARKELAVLSKAISILTARGWSVSLLSFHGNANEASDHGVLDLIAGSIPHDHRPLVRERSLSADADTLADVFSSIDVHCGMRFHGHVLAAIYEKPFVGISADNKIDAICGLFGMPVLPLGRLFAEDLVEAIDSALGTKIDAKVRDMSILNAQRNFAEFSNLVTPSYGRADA